MVTKVLFELSVHPWSSIELNTNDPYVVVKHEGFFCLHVQTADC